MTKLTGAALDRAVANALGVKSVHNCEKWGEHMNRIEEDDDIQDYKKPWVGLTDEESDSLFVEAQRRMTGTSSRECIHIFRQLVEAKLKEKNT